MYKIGENSNVDRPEAAKSLLVARPSVPRPSMRKLRTITNEFQVCGFSCSDDYKWVVALRIIQRPT